MGHITHYLGNLELLTYMTMKRLAINTMSVLGLVVLFVVLIKLGFWQLNSAVVKQQSMDAREKAMSVAMKKLPHVSAVRNYHGQRVSLSGHLDFEKTLLLDNKVLNGQVGYHVLIPFYPNIDESADMVLVDAGWVAAGAHRDVLPTLTQWRDIEQIRGFIYQSEHNPFIQKTEPQKSISFPVVINQFDTADLAKVFEISLYPAMVRLDPSSEWGYEKQWLWQNRMTPEKHRGYAVQWFALATTLLLLSSIFIWRLN
ncbi:SURF1 family protein [Psychrobium sp. nBUS_13]|uniref:SURF1 family protein n=1 Tax=Psychrobium sp. nBUS_13 TaxID=3395319 RepID=UPI003EB9F297